MFNTKSLFFKNTLSLTVLLLISPASLSAQTEFMAQNPDSEDFQKYLEDMQKSAIDNFSFEDMASEIYDSDLYKELLEHYNLDTESREFFTLETLPSKNMVPKPKEKIGLIVKTGLDSKTIHYTWVMDQEVVEEGYGLDIFNFTTKEIGEETNISVILKTDSGIERTKSITVTPAVVDFFWQTDTYTPPIYKGKKLSSGSNNGKIEFIAIPNFTGTDAVENPNDYIYSWRLNGSNYRSGRGMNSVSIDLSDILTKSSVKVAIKPLESKEVLRESINFPRFGKPEILIYPTDSYGINYSKAINYLNEYSLNQEFLTVKAEPVFFTYFQKDDLKINWSMNSNPIESFNNNDKAYFSVDRDFTGKSSVSVSIENKENFREKVNSNVLFSVNSRNDSSI